MIEDRIKQKNFGWQQTQVIQASRFQCGYCSSKVSSERGYKLGQHGDGRGLQVGGLFLCPDCLHPNFIIEGTFQIPSSPIGNSVNNVEEELNSLYEEARECTSINCYTAAVMVCRKIIMHIAVDKGADENLSFVKYVEYLANENYVPPNGKHWVDHIRKKGNEANHEIKLMTKEDSEELIIFIEMLLKFIYEFPSMIPNPNTSAE